MKNIYSHCPALCLPALVIFSTYSQAAQQPTIQRPDQGYMFHDETTMRPHKHYRRADTMALVSQNLPLDTVITAETDDDSQRPLQESRMVLIQKHANSNAWSVDCVSIKPTSIIFNSQSEAQRFALDFLAQSSEHRKQQQQENAALETKAKRRKLAQSKYRIH